MKTLFVVNPRAGRGTAQLRWSTFKSLLDKDSPFPFETHYTSRPGEVEAVSTQAIQSGYKRIIAVGGDGTINEVINGVIGSSTVVGVLPFGTGNDLARSVGVKKSDKALLHMLSAPGEVSLNVAKLNGRCFVNAAGIGFDGLVADYINRHGNLKKLGAFGYALSALTVLTSFTSSEALVKVDGRLIKLSNVWMIAIANCPYYGGGMKICPNARYDDDVLDVCVVSNLGKLSFLKFLPTVYSGKHVEKTQFITTYQAKQIEIAFGHTTIAHADGELMEASSIQVSVCKDRIRFLRG